MWFRIGLGGKSRHGRGSDCPTFVIYVILTEMENVGPKKETLPPR